MAIFKNTDMTNSNIDVSDWGGVAKKLADDWISKNPDAVETIAKEVVKVVREYNELNLNWIKNLMNLNVQLILPAKIKAAWILHLKKTQENLSIFNWKEKWKSGQKT